MLCPRVHSVCFLPCAFVGVGAGHVMQLGVAVCVLLHVGPFIVTTPMPFFPFLRVAGIGAIETPGSTATPRLAEPEPMAPSVFRTGAAQSAYQCRAARQGAPIQVVERAGGYPASAYSEPAAYTPSAAGAYTSSGPATYTSSAAGAYTSGGPATYTSSEPGAYTSTTAATYTPRSAAAVYSSSGPAVYSSGGPATYTSSEPGAYTPSAAGAYTPRSAGAYTSSGPATYTSSGPATYTSSAAGAYSYSGPAAYSYSRPGAYSGGGYTTMSSSYVANQS